MVRVTPVRPLLLCMWVAVSFSGAAMAEEAPHGLCTDCHTEGKELKTVPATLLCLTCHPSRRTDHPLVKVPPQMPATLPLDADRTMTCLTCHDPHGKGEGRKMLRKQNDELCQDCHQK